MLFQARSCFVLVLVLTNIISYVSAVSEVFVQNLPEKKKKCSKKVSKTRRPEFFASNVTFFFLCGLDVKCTSIELGRNIIR